jgi:TolB-like protein
MADTPLERLQAELAGRYVIDREIGRGGMATVYRAQDIANDRVVAIKMLLPELAASIGADRFLREIELGGTLRHPNIIEVLDSGSADGLLYYVMPFIEGESLRDKLDREKQLGIDEVLAITRQTADALTFAHQHGVIHRDIKPENILLTGDRVVVADFGIARAVTVAGGEKLTRTGMAVGTPVYMSPEQAMGSQDANGRSDVYSLGCVLYEMIAGQPPFSGPTAMAIMARHSLDQVPSLRIVRSAIPDEIDAAVQCALQKVPADRFATPNDFAAALATPGWRPRGGTRTTPAYGVAAKRRKPWGIVAGVGLTLAAVAGFFAWRAASGGASAAETGAPDPNRIAVLYFEKSAGAPDSLGYLADGLTEALIQELNGVKGLEVISSNGVRPYRQAGAAMDKVATDLKVGTLVSGSVAQSGDSLRVNVSLVNAANGVAIGTTTLKRPRAELFALQEDLAKEVSVFLREQLGKEVQIREGRTSTRNVAAWELYQRALGDARDADALGAAGDTAAAGRKFARTDSVLAEAMTKDARWATPSVLRGWLTYRQSRMAPSANSAYHAALIEQGLKHAEAALLLKADDPDALELRGTLRYWKWLNNLGSNTAEATQLYADAEKDLRGSVEANPTQASAWTTLSHLLINKPSLAEAKLAAMAAYEADPYLTNANVTVHRLFSTSYQLDDAVEAKRWCDEGRRRFPDFYRFAECRLWYYNMKGATPNVDSAWAALADYVKLGPPGEKELNQLKGQMRVAITLARAGLADSAKSLAEHSRGDANIDSARELAQLESLLYLVLGDKDGAFRHMSTWVASNPQQLESMSQDDSWEFRDLRKDPRFAAMMRMRK